MLKWDFSCNAAPKNINWYNFSGRKFDINWYFSGSINWYNFSGNKSLKNVEILCPSIILLEMYPEKIISYTSKQTKQNILNS